MEYKDIEQLVNYYHRKVNSVSLKFKRYLYEKINWDARLIGIKGARGVGKTTMLLQRIQENFANINDAFYVSLDDLWFENHNIEELVEFLYTHGVKTLFLDEVHKYRNWPKLLKNLYDNYPELGIVYTGSAMLAIDNSKTDLSRRQTLYTLHGMSLREYLQYEDVCDFQSLTLNEILENHVSVAMRITKDLKILKHFDEYLAKGYYPFYKEAGPDYHTRLREVVKVVVEGDVPAVENVSFETIDKLKKLLMTIAPNVPLEPNIKRLAEVMETTRDHCLKMLSILERAGMLYLLQEKPKDYKHLVNPQKIYLDNANLMYALSQDVSVGNMRETFFANQLRMAGTLTMPKTGDFLVDGKYLFEVGGRKKSYEQIKDIPDSFLAVDDIETGYGARIPLWLFGFLY